MEKEKEGQTGPTTIKTVPEFGDLIDLLTKIAVIAVVLPFILGVFILNFHSARFGIRYLGFLEIQYVLAGSCFLFIFGVGAGAFFASRGIYRNAARLRNTWKDSFFNVGLFLLVAVLWYGALIIPLGVLTGEPVLQNPSRVFLCTPIAVAVFLLSRIGRDISELVALGKQGTTWQAVLDRASYGVGWNALLIAGIVFCISGYSYSIFPLVNPAFGGGRPENAEILVTTEAKELVASLGYRLLPESRNIGRVYIIFETEDFLLLEPPEGHSPSVKSIRLPKSKVEAVFYIDD